LVGQKVAVIMDIKELSKGVDPNMHWYYQSKKLPLINYCKKLLEKTTYLNIVDIGAGSGFFSMELTKVFGSKIKKVFLVDTEYKAEDIESTKDSLVQKLQTIPQVEDNTLFLMMDVLEHIKEEQEILSQVNANKKNNNYFFITVPAFNSLWSGHDDFLEHFRRYTKSTLQKVLQQAQLTAQQYYYLYGSLFVPVWVYRKINKQFRRMPGSDMNNVPFFVNWSLLKLTSLEMKLTQFNKLAGLTCVAQGKL
jgi:2-polyprenyl-3-methyl-5-hydroxy-6-metoxy-1,4-benzoquinol methylase